MKKCILIPAYNEQNTIFQTVSGVKDFADVIVVNDCSSDNTAHVAKEAGAIVITPSSNLGYDGALGFGFDYARANNYSYLVTFDADGQHPKEMVPVYFNELLTHDLILGIRPHYARFAEFVFACYSFIFFGVKDPLCGMKGYKLDLLKDKNEIVTFQSIGTEIMFYLLAKKAKVKQLRIDIFDRLDQPRFGNRISANKKIIKALYGQILN